jgi:hypothetical protein
MNCSLLKTEKQLKKAEESFGYVIRSGSGIDTLSFKKVSRMLSNEESLNIRKTPKGTYRPDKMFLKISLLK